MLDKTSPKTLVATTELTPSLLQSCAVRMEPRAGTAKPYHRGVMVLDFERLYCAITGHPEKRSYEVDYYDRDSAASDLFDKLRALGTMHYYAAPKENFDMNAALCQVIRLGRCWLIAENMS